VATPVTQPTNHKTAAWIEQATRMSAVVVFVLYATGFLVVSLHHARYGIQQFDVFKSRIISAGVLFWLFAAIAIYQGLYEFGEFKSNRWLGPAESSKLLRNLLRAQALVFTSYVWAFFCSIYLYIGGLTVVGSFVDFGTFWFLLVLFNVVAVMAIRQRCDREPLKCKVLALLTLVVAAAGLYYLHNGPFALRFGWFFVVGIMAAKGLEKMRTVSSLHDVQWYQWLLNALAMLAVFAIGLYPTIPTGFGGGVPQHAQLFLTTPSPIDSTTMMDVWLVDESDSGFYVVRGRSDKDAVFLPRNSVSAVLYKHD
jgi:hypothetical protein